MSLNNVPVERCDMQEIDISIDLPEVVGKQINSPSDIQDLLVNVDDDDVAKFVATWLNEEATSGEFIPAVRHIMYASTMLSVASEMISAAEQEIEDSPSSNNSLCVEEMVLEEVAKRFHKGQATKVLNGNPELKHVIQQQLVGDYTYRVNKLKGIVETAKDLYRTTLDNNTLPLEERLNAAEKLKEINIFLDEFTNV